MYEGGLDQFNMFVNMILVQNDDIYKLIFQRFLKKKRAFLNYILTPPEVFFLVTLPKWHPGGGSHEYFWLAASFHGMEWCKSRYSSFLEPNFG